MTRTLASLYRCLVSLGKSLLGAKVFSPRMRVSRIRLSFELHRHLKIPDRSDFSSFSKTAISCFRGLLGQARLEAPVLHRISLAARDYCNRSFCPIRSSRVLVASFLYSPHGIASIGLYLLMLMKGLLLGSIRCLLLGLCLIHCFLGLSYSLCFCLDIIE